MFFVAALATMTFAKPLDPHGRLVAVTPLSTLLRKHLPDGWSGREVAREAARLKLDLSPATANNYLNGKIPAKPKVATLEAFAAVFRIDKALLLSAAGLPTPQERYRGPVESKLLDQRERLAIDELINVLLVAKRRGGGGASGQDFGPVQPSGPPNLSVVDDTLDAAALETEPGLDELPGGSDPNE